MTEIEVFEALASLKPNKAPGPHNIHSQVLKNCAERLAKPLFLLFTQSISTGILPSDWRRVNITPIFKKGSKVSPENYRPISLTSQVIKVLETLIRSKMMTFSEILLIANMVLLKRNLVLPIFDDSQGLDYCG